MEEEREDEEEKRRENEMKAKGNTCRDGALG